MSTIYRDRVSVDRARWNGASATYQLFKKSWSTSTIDDVEVYNTALVYWQGGMVLNPTQKRFINKLGLSYDELAAQNYKGVVNTYFKLNTAKYTYNPMDLQQIGEDLSNSFAIGDEFEVAVSYGGDLKRYVNAFIQPDGTGGHTVDTVGIRTLLNSDKVKYFANAATSAAGSMFQETETSIYNLNVGTNKTPVSTPVTKLMYDDTLAGSGKLYDCLAMLDDGTTFQEVEINTERVTAVETTDQFGNIAVIGEYSYIVKFKVIATPTQYSYITSQCSIIANALKDSMDYLGNDRLSFTNHSIDTLVKQAVLLMNVPSTHPAFYKGYLRVDYCANMKRKQFVKLLGKIFDTGYTKEKTSFWEKVVAIVIIIIAIVIIVFTWYAGGTGGWAMVNLGLGLMYASVFLTIALMLYAEAFPYATDMIKLIAGVATVVGYAAAVLSIFNLVQSSFMTTATNTTTNTATSSISTTVTASFSGTVTTGISTTATTTVTGTTIAQYLQLTGAVMQGAGVVASMTGDEELASNLRLAGSVLSAASATDFAKSLDLNAIMEEGNTTLADALGKLITEVTQSITELPQTLVDNISDIVTGNVLTDSYALPVGKISGWISNINTAMSLYNQFFVTPFVQPIGSEEQSSKEAGVEDYYAAINMIDNTDLLDRMSQYKENMFGGQQTEMYVNSLT